MGNNQAMSPSSSDWDHYWKQQNLGQRTYGLIANFYRKFIIRRTLNHHIENLFSTNSVLLHAGSGSGEVDLDICKSMELVAIDFSLHALSTYAKCHPGSELVAQADIFCLPFPNNTFDGIFNLGVMEHFNDAEMVVALNELKRVVKNEGTILLFWPPKWGLSVFALRVVHWLGKRLLNKNLNLHPAELNLLRSRKHCQFYCDSVGLEIVGFKFGPRDLFTHQIVTLRTIGNSSN